MGNDVIRLMQRALFWTLLPFVMPQALRVRKTATRFADAAGPSVGSAGRGPARRLIAVGDSIIAGVGAPTLDQALVGQTAAALAQRLEVRVDWWAFGTTGERSGGLLERLVPALPDLDADFVIVSMGVNDVTGLSTTRRFGDNMRGALDGLRRRYPRAAIAVAGLPPLGVFPLLPQPLRACLGLRASILDGVLGKIVADVAGAVFVAVDVDVSPERFSADGFHPSPAGYREFGDSMAAAFERIAAR
ncbi:MAG: SGNH/GDSL hydrolase family protein [Woeseiaceae bacterium]|jgi:lysophospholipase L1-like esterase|nr:SGNH/GDSL hydrolase family protein [Woeseiaceae bacterium]